ncbi:hypothetical protein RvY_03509 [Ramazzottius varieornatus]|uniref:Uncharacterized protein n=1 Tax=Ramazzottius varieornatus TaxID=947166 RepID=A0A1D1UNB8_RAMVA|nr:hypothetical protein RvY_03509 [Ramazzottius varieornatus]
MSHGRIGTKAASKTLIVPKPGFPHRIFQLTRKSIYVDNSINVETASLKGSQNNQVFLFAGGYKKQ